MATQDDPPTKIGELPLTVFELPKWLVEPAVRSCRLFNTALDFIFYDVPTLRAALAERDAPMQARGEKPPSRIIDFDALSDPEGSLLLIDATTAPYVHKYQSVTKFLESPYQETRDVDMATITGVGSSSLGSAALAWDISVALKKLAKLTSSFLAGTRGPRGTIWLDERGELQETPAFPVHTVDTLGAGDIFHGAFALAITEGEGVPAALRFASAAAALKCTRFGGAFACPQRSEVEALLGGEPVGGRSAAHK